MLVLPWLYYDFTMLNHDFTMLYHDFTMLCQDFTMLSPGFTMHFPGFTTVLLRFTMVHPSPPVIRHRGAQETPHCYALAEAVRASSTVKGLRLEDCDLPAPWTELQQELDMRLIRVCLIETNELKL